EGVRRRARVGALPVVDRGALDGRPAWAALERVEEPRMRGEVDQDAIDALAHQDDDVGLGQRAVALDRDGRGPDEVLGADAGREALPAPLDELAIGAAKPGNRDLAFRRERGDELRPSSLIAVEAPGLDQLRAGLLVGKRHGRPYSTLIPLASITWRQRPIS